jgi:hypothetical protein
LSIKDGNRYSITHATCLKKYHTLESWNISFSIIGEWLKKQVNILRSTATPGQNSLSNNVYIIDALYTNISIYFPYQVSHAEV